MQAPPAGGAQHFTAGQWEKLRGFADLLAEQGEIRGLLGPRELARLWDRHILNSLAILPDMPQISDTVSAIDGADSDMGDERRAVTNNSAAMRDSRIPTRNIFSVADIGSGAGFPGIVLAIMRTDLPVTLIETMERRASWLREVADTLALPNVEVVRERAENLAGKRSFDVVSARAVAPLRKLIPWAMPLVKPGGSLLALKGARAEQEIAEAQRLFRKYKLQWVDIRERSVWGTDEATRVVVAHKAGGRE